MTETKLVRTAWAAAGAGRIVAGDATGSGRWARVEYTGRNVYDGLDRLERATEGYWGRATEHWYNRAGARTGIFFPGETASPPPGTIPATAPSLAYRYDAQKRLLSVDRSVLEGGKASAPIFGNGAPAKRRNGEWQAVDHGATGTIDRGAPTRDDVPNHPQSDLIMSAGYPPADGRPSRRDGRPPAGVECGDEARGTPWGRCR